MPGGPIGTTIVEVLTAAIEAGATTLNIPDTVGYCVTQQFGDCIRYVLEKTPGIESCIISVHCHNDLGMRPRPTRWRESRQVRVRSNARSTGLASGPANTSLEEVVMMLKVRKDYFGVETGINTREIYRTSRLLSRITGIKVQPNKAVVGANAFAHEAGIHQDGVIKERTTYEIMHADDVGWVGDSMVMGKHSGRAALASRLHALGFGDLNAEDIDRAYDRFKALCDVKKQVYDEDLIAIVEDEVLQASPMYRLIDLETRGGMGRAPQVRIKIAVGNEERETTCTEGDGQIDALFGALDSITEEKINLLDFAIESVTSGGDALGRVKVVLSVDGREARGIGVATDIIIASVQAYLNALNRHALVKERLENGEGRPEQI